MTPKQRGLGRGLDALFEDEEATFATSASTEAPLFNNSRKTLGIGQLVPNPDQPRQYFDPKAIAELADSIRQHGLLQPILVRPISANSDMFEIVAGERRWRASQKAQLHEVPVIIREMDDAQVMQIALIENLQRQDLNAIEEAHGYQRLMDDFAYSPEYIGQAVGRSRSHVSNMVRLLALPQSVQTMVIQGDLSAGHARAIINAPNPALLAQEVVAQGLSVRQTEKLASDISGRGINKTKKISKNDATFKDVNIQALEKDLSDKLGLAVIIDTDEKSGGVVKINYKNLDQLDDVIARLSGRQG